uniref:Uncharacterized protein n=1 Tax=Opuntia streptacantha TaxID=393608 RepID=A0A7C9CNQ0_OPUST
MMIPKFMVMIASALPLGLKQFVFSPRTVANWCWPGKRRSCLLASSTMGRQVSMLLQFMQAFIFHMTIVCWFRTLLHRCSTRPQCPNRLKLLSHTYLLSANICSLDHLILLVPLSMR